MKPGGITLVPFDILAEMRFERDVRRLYQLGERALAEFLRERSEARSCRTLIDRRLAEYRRVDPVFLQALGGDHFPPRPLHVVRR